MKTILALCLFGLCQTFPLEESSPEEATIELEINGPPINDILKLVSQLEILEDGQAEPEITIIENEENFSEVPDLPMGVPGPIGNLLKLFEQNMAILENDFEDFESEAETESYPEKGPEGNLLEIMTQMKQFQEMLGKLPENAEPETQNNEVVPTCAGSFPNILSLFARMIPSLSPVLDEDTEYHEGSKADPEIMIVYSQAEPEYIEPEPEIIIFEANGEPEPEITIITDDVDVKLPETVITEGESEQDEDYPEPEQNENYPEIEQDENYPEPEQEADELYEDEYEEIDDSTDSTLEIEDGVEEKEFEEDFGVPETA